MNEENEEKEAKKFAELNKIDIFFGTPGERVIFADFLLGWKSAIEHIKTDFYFIRKNK